MLLPRIDCGTQTRVATSAFDRAIDLGPQPEKARWRGALSEGRRDAQGPSRLSPSRTKESAS
ncbi:MAG: hypothetical protein JWN61_602 [Pseudonocardiales bacterium]|nr:hypothetical protein [Pseudonocardiales bacterium]